MVRRGFNSELAQVDWESILARTHGNIDIGFSKIYNKLINKHGPLKPLSKQFSKPWIAKGLLKSIKNALFITSNILPINMLYS